MTVKRNACQRFDSIEEFMDVSMLSSSDGGGSESLIAFTDQDILDGVLRMDGSSTQSEYEQDLANQHKAR